MPFPSGEMLSLSASCGSAKHLEGICLQEKKGFFWLGVSALPVCGHSGLAESIRSSKAPRLLTAGNQDKQD